MSIQFACPICKTSYTVRDQDAGKKSECKTCGQRLQVPAPLQTKTVLGELPPATSVAREGLNTDSRPSAAEWAENHPPDTTQPPDSPSYPHWQQRTSGPANRIVASVAAGLLFIGLFLPMVHGPFGFWMSFIDMPWKAVTVGFAIADEVKKSEPEPTKPERPKPTPKPKQTHKTADPKEAEKARAGLLVIAVVVGSVIYPLVILAVVGFSAIQITTNRQPGRFVIIGIGCTAITAIYAVGVLLLNSIEELRMFMVLLSPGFGWAVMLIGSFMLVVAGRIGRTAPISQYR